jgi:hypothetical protein
MEENQLMPEIKVRNDMPSIRLASLLIDTKSRLTLKTNELSDSAKNYWLPECWNLLKESITAYNTKKLELAWRNTRALIRMEVNGYSRDECAISAKSIYNERTKLKKWRVLEIEDNLKDLIDKQFAADAVSDEKLRLILVKCMTVRDEHYDNEYYKIAVARQNLIRVLTTFGYGVIGFTLLYGVLTTFLQCDFFPVLGRWQNLAMVELLGFLGASFSLVSKFTNTDDPTNNIIGQVKENSALMYRTLVGPGAGFLIYVFFKAGLFNPALLSDTTGSNTASAISYFEMIAAFAAGFSEKLVIPLLEKFTPNSDETDTKTTTVAPITPPQSNSEGTTVAVVPTQPSGNISN